jgi:preprotein translocase subunit SecD
MEPTPFIDSWLEMLAQLVMVFTLAVPSVLTPVTLAFIPMEVDLDVQQEIYLPPADNRTAEIATLHAVDRSSILSQLDSFYVMNVAAENESVQDIQSFPVINSNETLRLETTTMLSLENVEDILLGKIQDVDLYELYVILTPTGQRILEDLTEFHVGEQIAVLINGTIIFQARILEAIRSEQFIITFSDWDYQKISSYLLESSMDRE